MSGEPPTHEPVLLAEALQYLAPRPGGSYIDATVGLGGHAGPILDRSALDGRLLAVDRDVQALEWARKRLGDRSGRVVFAHGAFADLGEIARGHGFERVDGVLFDLGISSLQLDDPSRGFAFRYRGPLDMRMDVRQEMTAAHIVNTWPEDELIKLIGKLGEERQARRIARSIVARRPLGSTQALEEAVAAVVMRRGHIHPATRTFQALRLAVNDELGQLEAALPQAVELLRPGGRLVVIAFHSLEDRIAKRFLARESRDCLCPPRVPRCTCGHMASVRLLTRRVVVPTDAEVARNPRSRSARLRAAERLGSGDERAAE